MTSTRFFSLAILLFIAISHKADAKLICSDSTLCIEDVNKPHQIDIYAINKKYRSVSASINVTMNNLKANVKFPFEFHLKGKQKKLLFSLVNGKKKYHYHYTYRWVGCNTKARHDNNYLYRLPYQRGKYFRIAQSCNGKTSHYGKFRYAIDFEMPIGTPVYVAREGVVIGVKINSDKGGGSKKFIEDVNYISIEHPDGSLAEYVHLKHHGATVKVGDKVKKGDLIGYFGNTGYTFGPHLHFAVFVSSDGKNHRSVPTLFDTQAGQRKCPQENSYLTPR